MLTSLLLSVSMLAEPVWGVGKTNETTYLSFRSVFTATAAASAQLRITASPVYRAFLNGRLVGYGPARAAEGWFKVDEWPVGSALRDGENELTVEVAGYRSNSYQYVIQPPFLQAEVVAGAQTLTLTPGNFTATEIAREKSGAVFSRQRGFPGERYVVDPDARPISIPLERVAGGKLRERAVPYPEFKINRDFKIVAGEPAPVWETTFNDTGFIGFEVEVTEPGRFEVVFDEAMVSNRIDLFRNGNPSNSWGATLDHLIWDIRKPGKYVLETYEPYTLKFVSGRLTSGSGKVSAPYLRQYRNPLPERATLESSDPDLDCIFRAACNSLAENGVDLYTDCPCRERSAWLCDTWFSAAAGAYLTGDFAVERAFLENFVLAPRFAKGVPDGATSGGYPGAGLLPTYLMWYVLQCDQYASRVSPAEAKAFDAFARERIFKNLNYLAQFENADGFLTDLPGWVFVCWSYDTKKWTTGVNYPCNMLWAMTLETAGRRYARPDLIDKARRLKEKIRQEAYDGRYFRDQQGGSPLSETCQYYAFFTGVATPETHAGLWDRLKNEFGPGKTADGLKPADMLVGRLLRLELFAREGDAARTAEEVKACVLDQARETGTFWEYNDGRNSRCHAFPSFVATLIVRDVIGLELDFVNKTVWLSRDSPLDHAKVSLSTPDGPIVYSFESGIFFGSEDLTLPLGWRCQDRNEK